MDRARARSSEDMDLGMEVELDGAVRTDTGWPWALLLASLAVLLVALW
jgi:hypothetical protein